MNIATITSAIASLSWLLVIGVVVIAVVRSSRGQRLRNQGTLLLASIGLAVVLNVISAGLVFVQPQERSVVISAVPGRQGIRANALEPGLNWIIPFFENVQAYPISRQTYTMSGMPQEGAIQGDDSVQARTSDGQVVFVDASVIFRIDPDQAVDVHIRWQNNYVDNLIRPQARGVIRDWVSQFGVEGVYSSNREELTLSIEEDLQTRLSDEGLELIDFVMRNITFSPEYAASVEQKQIAEQLAQQAVFVVEQRKQEAEQARQQAQGLADAAAIRAEGDARAILINAQADADARLLKAEAEAEALSMLAASIRQNPDVLTLEYIQRLSPNISVMLLPSENPLLLPLPSVEELGSSLGTSPLPTPLPSPSEGDTP
jgi:regulator of protease activity HflC (stomatin/prohibitin superfamily)